MAVRKIHLVGTFPPEISAAGIGPTFAWAVRGADGVDLVGLPCDLDDRWIIRYLDDLAARPQLRAIRTGDSGDYDRMPIYRPVRGAPGGLRAAVVNTAAIDHAQALARAYRAAGEPTGAPLQLSRPNPLDIALFTFCGRPSLKHPVRSARGAGLALRHLSTFQAAFDEENRRMGEEPARRLWQLESPAVLFGLILVPRPVRGPVARLMARQVAGALASLPDGDEHALHLCYGDLDNTAVVEPTDTTPIVLFLNALGDRLAKRGRRALPRVHLPFAWGAEPPPTRASYYAPLRRLRHAWPISAGVVKEGDPETSQAALRLVEDALGRTVDAVGKPCGLGRHDAGRAEAAMATSVTVARA